MKKYIYIIISLVLLNSCSKRKVENLNGLWRIGYDQETENPFFPYELLFKNDSLILVDGNNFRHKIKHKINWNSIEMSFQNGNIKKARFKIYSDSIISFDSKKFHKTPDNHIQLKPYKLIDYKTNELLTDNNYYPIIHLIKNENLLKVVLNDRVADLEKIPHFFMGCNTGPQPPLIIYIGEGVNFNDLIEAYLWIKVSGVNSVILVTKNDTYDKFYALKDVITIDSSLMNNFLTEKNIPLAPPITKQVITKTFEINTKTNLEKLPSYNETEKISFKVTNTLDLITYLKLIEKMKDKNNIEIEITANNND